jgi:hypothetical protein
MDTADLDIFRTWFAEFCESFSSVIEEDQKNISLKIKHTYRVCENIAIIAEDYFSEENDILLSEAIALFHDVGRFPQFAQYKTFRDSISVNHGKLGAEVLEQEGILHRLSEHEKAVIMHSVRFHNAFALAKHPSHEMMTYLKLIRDADKLDVWRVFAEIYETDENKRPSAVNLGMLDLPEYSEKVILNLYNNKVASLSDVRSLNDFKLMQLSWIFDLNFKASFRLLSEKGHIKRIAAGLPRNEEIGKVVTHIQDCVYARC